MPAPFVWSTPAVTSQTQETEDSSQDGEHRLEFFTTECLYYQHQEMCTLHCLSTFHLILELKITNETLLISANRKWT